MLFRAVDNRVGAGLLQRATQTKRGGNLYRANKGDSRAFSVALKNMTSCSLDRSHAQDHLVFDFDKSKEGSSKSETLDHDDYDGMFLQQSK